MWRRGAGVLAAVLAAKTNQRCHALAEAGVSVPASLHTTAQQTQQASSSTADQPVGQHHPQQSPHPGPSSNSASSTSSSSSNSTSRPSPWPPSLREGTHFAVLTGDGVPARLSSIAAAMQQSGVALLGEYHDDPVAHALQLELLKRAAKVLGYQLPSPTTTAAAAADTTRTTRPGTDAYPAAATRLQQQQQGVSDVLPPQRRLVLSLEMFERDVQPVLDEYLAGSATLADLMRDARPWPNHRRDYQPLVDFCKGLAALHNNARTAAAPAPANLQELNNNSNASGAGAPASLSTNSSSSDSGMVRVIAANAPRRYVSLAGRAGRQALLQLPLESQAFLAPLPYAQPSQAYVAKVTGSMRQAAADMQQHRAQQQQQQQQQDKPEQQQLATEKHSSRSAAAVAGEAAADGGACPYIGFNVSSNFLDAQCLWDSTMAHSIAQQLLTAGNAPSCAHSVDEATAAASSIRSTSATAIGSTIAGDVKTSILQQQQQQEGPLVIHVCGKFHAEHRLGIPEHLQQYVPGARVLVVTFVPADSMVMDLQQFEAAGLKGSADFVVLTDGSLPRSFASVHPV